LQAGLLLDGVARVDKTTGYQYTPDMLFDWDPGKAESNLCKHAVIVFDDLDAIDEFDEFNSVEEDRFIIIGISKGFVLHVVYTERAEKTRIISARKATKHEQSLYYRTKTSRW
jgi:uncharacterized protein